MSIKNSVLNLILKLLNDIGLGIKYWLRFLVPMLNLYMSFGQCKEMSAIKQDTKSRY